MQDFELEATAKTVKNRSRNLGTVSKSGNLADTQIIVQVAQLINMFYMFSNINLSTHLFLLTLTMTDEWKIDL